MRRPRRRPAPTSANAEMPALHPTRSGGGSGRGRAGRLGRRGRPRRAGRVRHPRRVAWLEVDVERFLAHPHGGTDLPAGEPVPVVRHRPGLRDRRGHLGHRRRRPSPTPPASCSAGSACSTPTGATGVAQGSRSLAYRVRLQAADRTLTDAEVGDVRRRIIDAVEACPPRLPASLTPQGSVVSCRDSFGSIDDRSRWWLR